MTKLISQPPRVLIVLDVTYSTNKALLNGILHFSQIHAPWITDIKMGRRGEKLTLDASANPPDGIIASATFGDLICAATKRHIPTIVDGRYPVEAGIVGTTICDNAAISTDAFEHLRNCGLSQYAFVPEPSGQWWSTERLTAFAQNVSRQPDATLHVFDATTASLEHWLAALPKPVALFAADDIRARQVADAARLIGAQIPDDIALIGVDNDTILCETTSPALSSIELQTFDAGLQAAQLLADRMSGAQKARRKPKEIRYGGIVFDRPSSHFLLTPDPLVSQCRKLLEDNMRSDFSVSSLLPILRVSRRNLEMRFKAATGRTIHQDLTEMRINLAKKLLRNSRLSQGEIAEACGFHDASHLSVVFRRLLHARPSDFRLK